MLPALLAALLGILIAAPGAGAVSWPGFAESVDLTPPDAQAYKPRAAVSGDGEYVAVWLRSTANGAVVQAAGRPAGGVWSAPVNLTSGDGDALDPQVAISAGGDAVAVWRRSTSRGSVVQAATRPAGADWSAPAELSSGNGDALDPRVAISAGGDVVAVWNRVTSGGSVVQAAFRRAGSSWKGPDDLSRAGVDAYLPHVAISTAGDAVAVWDSAAAGRLRVESATRPAAGAWSVPTALTPADANALDPQVAINAQDEAVAVWVRYLDGASLVQAATRRAAGPWSAPEDLARIGARSNGLLPKIGMGAAGDAVVVWGRSIPSAEGSIPRSIVQAASRAAGGAWSVVDTLTAGTGIASDPQLAVSPSGAAVVVWRNILPNGDAVVQVATRGAAGTWSDAADLTSGDRGAEASSPHVAVGGNGSAIVVWQRLSALGSFVQAAVATATANPAFLESHAPAHAGPPTVATPVTLRQDTPYRVMVTGAYSRWEPARMAVTVEPGWVVCGLPENEPLFPSGNLINGRTTSDAEFLFARPERGTACSTDASTALPKRQPTVRFSVDGGETFRTLPPDGGAPTSPDPRHSYAYTVVGDGRPLTVILDDSYYEDNAGQLRLVVSRLGP